MRELRRGRRDGRGGARWEKERVETDFASPLYGHLEIVLLGVRHSQFTCTPLNNISLIPLKHRHFPFTNPPTHPSTHQPINQPRFFLPKATINTEWRWNKYPPKSSACRTSSIALSHVDASRIYSPLLSCCQLRLLQSVGRGGWWYAYRGLLGARRSRGLLRTKRLAGGNGKSVMIDCVEKGAEE